VAEYPEFRGNVAFVGTRKFYRSPEDSPLKQEYHWNGNAETYYLIGEAMGQAMVSLSGSERWPFDRRGLVQESSAVRQFSPSAAQTHSLSRSPSSYVSVRPSFPTAAAQSSVSWSGRSAFVWPSVASEAGGIFD
jgi:hypothetical protein